MGKAIKNILRWTNCHKWQTGICAGVAILAIGAGITGATINLNSQKLANSKALIELADENGIITSEQIENAGDLADLGTEIETDQGTVVLTQDENGNIVSTLIKDSEGNSTGAIVPGNSNGNTSGGSAGGQQGGSSSEGATHSHTWIPHYATRTVTTTVHHAAVYGQEGYNACATCGVELSSREACHTHAQQTGHTSTYVAYRQVVVTPAYDEPVTTTEQYIDYYYCSGCGTRQ